MGKTFKDKRRYLGEDYEVEKEKRRLKEKRRKEKDKELIEKFYETGNYGI